MGTKVKGFFKGLKHFPNIFDEEEKQEEIQIGMPTDVKHVAHIGADGPAVESPSWMRDFDGGESQSGPLDMTPAESPDIKKGTKNHRISRSEEITRDVPDVPKTSRHRRRSMDNALDSDSQGKDSSTKSKHTRRHHKVRKSHDVGDESPNTKLPDIPKKCRRKKAKEDGDSTKSTMSKASESSEQ